jgi:hypothetical protein
LAHCAMWSCRALLLLLVAGCAHAKFYLIETESRPVSRPKLAAAPPPKASGDQLTGPGQDYSSFDSDEDYASSELLGGGLDGSWEQVRHVHYGN